MHFVKGLSLQRLLLENKVWSRCANENICRAVSCVQSSPGAQEPTPARTLCRQQFQQPLENMTEPAALRSHLHLRIAGR